MNDDINDSVDDFENEEHTIAVPGTELVLDVGGFEGPIDVLLTLARDQKVDLTHDSKLPTEVLQAAIGKEVKLLSYPNTKDSTSKWDIVSHANSDSGAFVDYFVEQYEKSKARKNGPYPKNFRVDDPSDSFEFGANREEPAPQVSSL